ncbi:Digestive cysteine proteinase 2 [Amphibalanus amphitrite]|uniref:Digestive cysteine proteinase 2 n=1 Tax=Amphibalanus amphitrite TaxID=1232801 RepID=A0A6A4V6R0_AMPAM|nr:Digestive cysteine proteinase 2 [Amphibalanus amphitrite]
MLYHIGSYIKDNGGIESDASYPYTASDGGRCKATGHSVATLSSYVDIPAGSETDLLDAVATAGPVVVVVDATRYGFQMYSGGVYDDPGCSATYENHSALAVGYGTEDGKDYWLVKNSWGTDWGADGYIKMRRNANSQCGIADMASYPVV